jgi:hypothetical protein
MARTTLNRSRRDTHAATASRDQASAEPVPASPHKKLPEWPWTAGVGVVALGLFLATFSPNVALGDAPESVTGVKSLGVLHAPGYPTYVLLGHLWSVLVPFGSWAERLNLFSVVTSVVAIMALFALGRAFGASRAGAAIGALSVATSISFWFNAGFAKHYALSAMLLTLATLLVVTWQRDGGRARIVGAGVALGACAGASWELAAIMTVGLAALVLWNTPRPRWGELLPALGAAVAVGTAVWLFVLVRGGQDPTINWGRVTSLGRLVDLARQKDFLNGGAAPNGVRALPQAPHRALSYGIITTHELGVAAIVVALIGLVALVRRRRLGDTLFFFIVILGNLASVVFISGLQDANGIWSGLVVGGYLIDLILLGGVLVGLGADALGDLAVTTARAVRPHPGRGGDTPSGSLARQIVVSVVALAVLVPSVVVHEKYATHRGVDFADDYAHQILTQLPNDAVLIGWGWEFVQPYIYRQAVYGERGDVKILDADELNLRWYREEVARLFGAMAPSPALEVNHFLAALLNNALVKVPVFVDMSAAGQFSGKSGLVVDGALAELVPGHSITGHRGFEAMSQDLHAVQQRDGWFGSASQRFPNRSVSLFEMRAELLLAALAVGAGNEQIAVNELQTAARIRPDIQLLRRLLSEVQARDPQAQQDILRVATAF